MYTNPLASRLLTSTEVGGARLGWLALGTPGVDWRSGGYYAKNRPSRTTRLADDPILRAAAVGAERRDGGVARVTAVVGGDGAEDRVGEDAGHVRRDVEVESRFDELDLQKAQAVARRIDGVDAGVQGASPPVARCTARSTSAAKVRSAGVASTGTGFSR
jgi:hypothetical protein